MPRNAPCGERSGQLEDFFHLQHIHEKDTTLGFQSTLTMPFHHLNSMDARRAVGTGAGRPIASGTSTPAIGGRIRRRLMQRRSQATLSSMRA